MKTVAKIALCAAVINLGSMAAANVGRPGQRGLPPGTPAAAPATPVEVLMGSAWCSTTSIQLDFKATGGVVDGLQRPFVQGSSNFLFVRVDDCPAVVAEITQLLRDRQCETVSGSSPSSVGYVCDGERNEVVGIVGNVLRLAFAAATSP